MTGDQPRLILLNGPPGIGKSTIARRYADEHPLTLALDLDVVRGMLGRWQEHPTEAGLLARAVTVEMARAHLRSGHDVIIPQYLGRPEFIDQVEALAADVGVPFHEYVLMDERDRAIGRFVDRTSTSSDRAHVEAGALLDQLGGRPTLEAMYDRLLLVLSHRPKARIIQSRHGDPGAVYAELVRLVDG